MSITFQRIDDEILITYTGGFTKIKMGRITIEKDEKNAHVLINDDIVPISLFYQCNF